MDLILEWGWILVNMKMRREERRETQGADRSRAEKER